MNFLPLLIYVLGIEEKNLKNNLLEHVDQFPLSAKFLSHRPEQLTMQNFIDIYLSRS